MPVVGAAVGGLLDSVVDGVTGLLVPPRRPGAARGGPEPCARRRGPAAAPRRAAAEHVRGPLRVAPGRRAHRNRLHAAGRRDRRRVAQESVRSKLPSKGHWHEPRVRRPPPSPPAPAARADRPRAAGRAGGEVGRPARRRPRGRRPADRRRQRRQCRGGAAPDRRARREVRTPTGGRCPPSRCPRRRRA